VAQQLDNGGFLWIKGNPGTGKSTLMKFLFEKTKSNAKGDFSQITLSFFFLARGTVEEKSTTGLYRSLLHQLFEKAMDLRDSLEWMTANGARVVQRNGWHGEALKQTLTHAVQKLGSRLLTIFIDALDECDKNQAAGMICFFEELCDCAREAQVRLQICFSSRHYPTIVIQRGIEITLEDEIGHKKDIEQYINSKLRLGKSKLKQAESLRSEILEKSSSIFLWVVLVLDILNSEYPDGFISIKKIRERLKEIPPKLTDLFEMILTRDGENLERLQICLKWILFATRPLKPQELYFAVQLSLDKECLGFWDQEDVDLEQIKTFVRSSSKGLAEVTRNKASEVQFIHESVRDFLVGKYKSQWSGSSGNFVGYGHEILRNCCLAQLNASINKDVDIPDPLPRASKAAELRKTISLKFPFLEYSVLSVLHHANSAQQNAIEQGDFLADFPLQRWIFLNNTFERYDVRRYTESVSLLYILAEKNLAPLIRIHPQRESPFNVENERYGLPIFAALATGSYKAVQTFLEVQAKIRPQEPLLHHLCKQYSENRNKCTNFGRNFTFSRYRNISSHVAEQGDEAILTFLCALSKLDVESKDGFNRTPLSWAAEKGHEAVVKLLLEKGAEPDAKDKDGRTPLSWAAAVTPLSYAICGNHTLEYYQIQLMVLEQQNKKRLMMARQVQDNIMLHPDGQGGAGAVGPNGQQFQGTSTQGGPHNSPNPGDQMKRGMYNEVVEKLLLGKWAESEAKDKSGRTPLSWAVEKGHEAVVKLLLENGAEPDKNKGRTPPSWATKKGHEAVVKLLLEKGAELDAKDKDGRTPLSWAAEKSHEAVVKLLLEEGAELEAKDKDGRTPLSWAAEKGREAVVKLLLEKGTKPH